MDRLTQIVNYIVKKLMDNGVRVDEVILFGSRLFSEHSEDSDYDLAVISDSFCNMDLYERGKLMASPLAQTIWHFGVPIDTVELTNEELKDMSRPISFYVSKGRTLFTSRDH